MRSFDLPLVILAFAALLYLPGWLVLVAAGWRARLDPMLRPVAAVTVTLALLAPALALCLWRGWPGWCLVAWLVPSALVAGTFAWRRRSPVRVDVTAIGAATVAIALLGGVLAAWTGGDPRRDQTYHAGRVVKLVELESPTFESASRIEGGGATTPYAFPLWHGAQATVVIATGVEPLVLGWLLPALLVPISVLAYAGLARAWIGTPEAGLAAAIAWLAMRVLDYAPDYRFLTTAQWPGMVAAMLVVPLVCALVLPALDDDRRTRTMALALGALGVLVVLGLHANYVLFPALLVAGALVWMLVVDRDVSMRRVLALCSAWGGAAALGLLALLPVLRDHAGPAVEGSGVDALVRGSRNANYFEQLAGGWVLKLEPLVGQSLTVLAFAIAAMLALFAPRHRVTALAAAGLAAVVLVARVPPVTEAILGLGNLTAVTRLWLAVAVPTTLAMAAALLWAVAPGPRRQQRAVFLLVAVVGAFAMSPARTQDARELVVWLLLGAVVVGIVLALVGRSLGVAHAGELPDHDAPSEPLRPRALVVLSVAGLLVATVLGLASESRFDRAVHRDPILGEAWDARAELRRELEPGDVVLADEFDSYALPAVAPVYVVGDYKWWLERSDHNDTIERLEDVRRYFAADPADRVIEYDIDVIVTREAGPGTPTGPWRVIVVDGRSS